MRDMMEQQREMKTTSNLIPRCPVCGTPLTMNLRCDAAFVQDDCWYAAQNRYTDFLRRHKQGRILYLELGVDNNTPAIIKYPFWRYTLENPEATYACVNFEQAYAPGDIAAQFVCLNADIGLILPELQSKPARERCLSPASPYSCE